MNDFPMNDDNELVTLVKTTGHIGFANDKILAFKKCYSCGKLVSTTVVFTASQC